MVRLVGQEVTGACKAKAQSGALLRVGGAVVPFCFAVKEDRRGTIVIYPVVVKDSIRYSKTKASLGGGFIPAADANRQTAKNEQLIAPLNQP